MRNIKENKRKKFAACGRAILLRKMKEKQKKSLGASRRKVYNIFPKDEISRFLKQFLKFKYDFNVNLSSKINVPIQFIHKIIFGENSAAGENFIKIHYFRAL